VEADRRRARVAAGERPQARERPLRRILREAADRRGDLRLDVVRGKRGGGPELLLG